MFNMPQLKPLDVESELSDAREAALSGVGIGEEAKGGKLQFSDEELAELDLEALYSIEKETEVLLAAENRVATARGMWVDIVRPAVALSVLLLVLALLLPRPQPTPLNQNWIFFTLVGLMLFFIFESRRRTRRWRHEVWEAKQAVLLAQEEWREALVVEGQRPAILKLIAEKSRNLDLSMRQARAPGLMDFHDATRHIQTNAHELVRERVENTSSAVIGIAGPRGVGKSTILHDILERAVASSAAKPAIAVGISVPRRYDPQELVVHLFRKVVNAYRDCRETFLRVDSSAKMQKEEAALRELEGRSGKPTTLRANALGRELRRSVSIAWALGLPSRVPAEQHRHSFALLRAHISTFLAGCLGVCLVFVGLLTLTELASQPAPRPAAANGAVSSARARSHHAAMPPVPVTSPPDLVPDAPNAADYVAATGLEPGWLMLAGLLLIVWAVSSISKGPSREVTVKALQLGCDSEDLDVAADAWSRRLAYQESYMSGWSSGLKGGAGLEAGECGSNTIANLALSLPEAVDGFRCFVRRLAKRARLVVGIDELDKMEPAEAQAFLNDIKVIFDTPESHYLLTLSDSAMSSFARRGFPVRDVFDSSLDDVIAVTYLTWHEALALVNRRVLRMPQPFIALCYCLSGGLPRDLLRLCRELVRMVDAADDEVHISRATRQLVSADLNRKRRAVMDAVSELDSPETPPSLWDLGCFDFLSSNPDQLRRYARVLEAPGEPAGPKSPRLHRLLSELAAYLEYCAILLVAFEDFHITYLPSEECPDEESFIHKLTQVRRAFEVNPSMAREGACRLVATVAPVSGEARALG